MNTVIFYDGYWWISSLIHRNWRSISPSVLRTSGDIASQFLWMSAWYSPISIIKNDSILSLSFFNQYITIWSKELLQKIIQNSNHCLHNQVLSWVHTSINTPFLPRVCNVKLGILGQKHCFWMLFTSGLQRVMNEVTNNLSLCSGLWSAQLKAHLWFEFKVLNQ